MFIQIQPRSSHQFGESVRSVWPMLPLNLLLQLNGQFLQVRQAVHSKLNFPSTLDNHSVFVTCYRPDESPSKLKTLPASRGCQSNDLSALCIQSVDSRHPLVERGLRFHLSKELTNETLATQTIQRGRIQDHAHSLFHRRHHHFPFANFCKCTTCLTGRISNEQTINYC